MPAGLFHTTFSELLAEAPGLRAAAGQAVRAEPVYARFGAMLPDLPYYRSLPALAVQFGLGRVGPPVTWASLIHGDRPADFFAAFVRAVREHSGPLTQLERLALVTGLASHEAADSAIHPLVNWCARRDAAQRGGDVGHHHRVVEKHQCLFFHLERFGDDPVGTVKSRQAAVITKRRTWIRSSPELHLVEIVQKAFRLAHGAAPTTREVGRWVRALRHVGLALASRLARRDSERSRREDLRLRYYRSESFDFDHFFDAARVYAVTLANLAADYYEAGDFSSTARDAFVAAVDLDPHIGAPTDRRGPPLPPG